MDSAPWTHSYSAQVGGGSSSRALPFVLALSTGSNTTEGDFLKLYSTDRQRHKWGHADNALKNCHPTNFNYIPTLGISGRRDEVFVLTTQSI